MRLKGELIMRGNGKHRYFYVYIKGHSPIELPKHAGKKLMYQYLYSEGMELTWGLDYLKFPVDVFVEV